MKLRKTTPTACCTGQPCKSCALHALILAAALTLTCHSALAQVELKARTILFSAETTAQFIDALKATPDDTLHGLVMFSKHPTLAQRKALEEIGVRVLAPLRGTAYRVRVRKPVNPAALASSELTPLLAQLLPKDRVEPSLWKVEPRACICELQPNGGCACETDDLLNLTVRIHAGVPKTQVLRLLDKHTANSHGGPRFTTYDNLSDEVWMVYKLSRSSLEVLAKEDVVQWVNATPTVFDESDKSRAAINVDAVQKFDESKGQARGLGGRGVQVGLFDSGLDESHGDFSKGRVIRNDAGMDRHATHMAGIIAGNGRMSTEKDSCGGDNRLTPGSTTSRFQWRGMAPLAELIDIPRMQPFGKNGANAATHRHYIKEYGMDLSNHSYGFNRNGTYDNSNAIRDQLIRGDAVSDEMEVPGRLHITSAGNRPGYYLLSKQLKNALVVGNWNVRLNGIDGSSSQGPTQDGRTKPDVAAPGTRVMSTTYCSGTATQCQALEPRCKTAGGAIQRQNYYKAETGASVASAVATGAIALVLEQYAKSYDANLDRRPPLPSTLRAVMVHTATHQNGKTGHPLGSTGSRSPNFVSGWGLIDAQAAVNIVKKRLLIEGTISGTCEAIEYIFHVQPGTTGAVRVTLSWDDVAADSALPDTLPKLVNDLDLVLVDPNGRHYYPWRLDQKIVDVKGDVLPDEKQQCGTMVTVNREFLPPPNHIAGTLPPVAVIGRDHLNNLEVVDVDSPPASGSWRAIVSGFNIPQGPQRFSLVGERFRILPTAALPQRAAWQVAR